MDDIIYFELNNWFSGEDYPNAEPFTTWCSNDMHLYFDDEDFVQENKLCVVSQIIDMSVNWCITATKEWVKKTCPELLTKYKEFLRFPDEDNTVYGRFGTTFQEYNENNIGIHWIDDD